MIPFILINTDFEFGMAGKTFGIGNLFAQNMALCTIAHAFEVRMYLGQMAGRNLCFSLKA